ncbi:helix-turn-helix domain-containing protein [Bacillus paralicheniformis]|uniref:helix-turn-helix domain-containing protein n=1 Tax=Bacillus paralicheniformis TaxID=1648923 RepID=UPI003F79648D
MCRLLYVKTDRIDEILKERGWSRSKLAQEANVRPASVSELCSNSRSTINRLTLFKIMKALNITDVSDILEIRD